MDTLNEGVEDLNTAEEELQEHMNIFLYLIVIFTKIKKSNSSNERFEAMKTIYQVCTADTARAGFPTTMVMTTF